MIILLAIDFYKLEVVKTCGRVVCKFLSVSLFCFFILLFLLLLQRISEFHNFSRIILKLNIKIRRKRKDAVLLIVLVLATNQRQPAAIKRNLNP